MIRILTDSASDILPAEAEQLGVTVIPLNVTLEDGTVRRYEEPVNRRYEREMEYFVDYARNGTGESVNPPRTALEVLALTQGETLG